MSRILVLGSLNVDMLLDVPHLPGPGETVLGGELRTLPGGKGANQAVAAARLGGAVSMAGRVGADRLGAFLLEKLRAAGVDVDLIELDEAGPTGAAIVLIDGAGENSIAVAPGANARVGEPDAERATARLGPGDMLVMQLEIPVEAVAAAARRARAAGATVLLNAAPARELPHALLPCVDVLVLNEGEAARLGGSSEAGAAGRRLRELGAGAVVITRGAQGATIVAVDGESTLSPPAVDPVDTTGAGDAFVGAIAIAIVGGAGLRAAVALANAAGAAATLAAGAQEALPTIEALAALDPGAAAGVKIERQKAPGPTRPHP